MSDLKQEALEAALEAGASVWMEGNWGKTVRVAIEAYEARRAGEAAACQVTEDEVTVLADPRGQVGQHGVKMATRLLNVKLAQRPAQPAGVEWTRELALQLGQEWNRVARIPGTIPDDFYGVAKKMFGALCPSVKPADVYVAQVLQRASDAERELAECREQLAAERGRADAYEQASDAHEADAEAAKTAAYDAEAKLTEANALIDALNTDCAAFQHDRACAEAREKRLREACAWPNETEDEKRGYKRTPGWLQKSGYHDVAAWMERIQAALADTAQLAEPESAKHPAKSEPVSVPDELMHDRIHPASGRLIAAMPIVRPEPVSKADELPKPGDVLDGEQAKAYLLSVPGARVRARSEDPRVYSTREGVIGYEADGHAWRRSRTFAGGSHGGESYTVLPPATQEPNTSESPNSSVTLEGLAARVDRHEQALRALVDRHYSLDDGVRRCNAEAVLDAEGEG